MDLPRENVTTCWIGITTQGIVGMPQRTFEQRFVMESFTTGIQETDSFANEALEFTSLNAPKLKADVGAKR